MPMTATTLPTPADLSITPRDRRFGREAAAPRFVARRTRRGDCYLQCIVGDLPDPARPISSKASASSAKALRRSSPKKSRRFTTQEAIHSREHDAFNKRAADAGYDLSKLEARREASRDNPRADRRSSTSRRPWRSSISPRSWRTNCSPTRGISTGAEKEAADLWRWHAVEEIEHKGVAYDTWLYATRDWPRFKRWKVKAKVMLSSLATSSSIAPPDRSS